MRYNKKKIMPPETIIPPVPDKPTIIDLFAGVGGISLGATRAGFQLSLAVELDDKAYAAHKLNFPNSNHLKADVADLTRDEILHAAGLEIGQLDGMVGGPPCQGFSNMGLRETDDPRNNLFVNFFELVADCRPKFFVAENVLGILHPDYDPIRKAALEALGDDYVTLDPIRIKASDLGAPTTRERAFFIGYRSDYVEPIVEADLDALRVETPIWVEEALDGLPEIRDEWLDERQSWQPLQLPTDERLLDVFCNGIPEGVGDPEAIRRYQEDGVVSGCFATRHSPALRERYGALEQGAKEPITKSVRLRADGLCPTLRAGTGPDRGSHQAVRPIHPTESRVIAPREAARLQGFPDWFQFDGTKWHSFRQIGNSVSPIVAEAILRLCRNRLID
jgi:DNA (cytosine-5)-methyltransferase 1